MKRNTLHNEPVPELFEISGKFAVGVLAVVTFLLICLFGLDHLKLALGVVVGALLFSFAMEGISSGLVGVFCGTARGIGRGLGYLVSALRG